MTARLEFQTLRLCLANSDLDSYVLILNSCQTTKEIISVSEAGQIIKCEVVNKMGKRAKHILYFLYRTSLAVTSQVV